MSSVSVSDAAPPPADVKARLRASLLWSFFLPVLLLVFFLFAPGCLNSKVHTQISTSIYQAKNLPYAEQTRRIAALEKIDFNQIAFDSSPEVAPLRTQLEEAGILADFHRLRWALWLSLALCTILLGVTTATALLNRLARQSPGALIRHYRTSWKLGMVAALAQVFLLIPLLTYGLFEATVIAFDRYFPQLLIALVIGGGVALWKTAAILIKNVPMEFEEPMSRAVTAEEAPELWQAVREASARLHTAPPDHIVIGMQMNFYVTELAVKHAAGRAEGRTLFLSQPLLKQLSPDETLAIIGHELGHFIGDDTRMTREFYPFRHKVHATMFTLAQSGLTGWTSLQSLNFFSWCFGTTEQAHSRQREFIADGKAAELTSPGTAARALVKFHVVHEAFQIGFAAALRNRAENPLDLPLQSLIREQLLPRAAFWSELFDKKSPHPLDSHPTLHLRLESLGQTIGPEDAKAMATAESESAFARWFSGREALFTDINHAAAVIVDQMRARVEVASADVKSAEGRKLLATHFPEKRFRGRDVRVNLICFFLGLLAAGFLLGVILIPGVEFRALFLALSLTTGWPAFIVWRRHRGAELVLNAEGLSYTGWRRPLRFEDVMTLDAQNHQGSITLTFRLKGPHSNFWRYALLRYPQKSVSLPLPWIDAKQPELAQTIYNYFTRQLVA